MTDWPTKPTLITYTYEAEPECSDAFHYNQEFKAPGKWSFGCTKCNRGWSYDHIFDNVFDGLMLLQWLGKNGRKVPADGARFVIEPLLATTRKKQTKKR